MVLKQLTRRESKLSYEQRNLKTPICQRSPNALRQIPNARATCAYARAESTQPILTTKDGRPTTPNPHHRSEEPSIVTASSATQTQPAPRAGQRELRSSTAKAESKPTIGKASPTTQTTTSAKARGSKVPRSKERQRRPKPTLETARPTQPLTLKRRSDKTAGSAIRRSRKSRPKPTT